MKAFIMLLLAVAMTGWPAAVFAAPADLDPSFGGDGKVATRFDLFDGGEPVGFGFGEVGGMAIQPDRKIVVVGTATPPDLSASYYTFTVARYNMDGSLDASFGAGGLVFTDLGTLWQEANAVLIQPNGKIVVGGGRGLRLQRPEVGLVLARFNTDGSLDTTFGTDGVLTRNAFPELCGGGTRTITALGLRPDDGKIVAAVECGFPGRFVVARFNANGRSADGTGLDTSFGTGGVATPLDGGRSLALALQPDGKIVAAGPGFEFGFAVVRLNSDGSLDSSFSGDGRVAFEGMDARAVALQAGGKIVVAGGGFTERAGLEFALARLNPNGSLDTSFGGDGRVATGFLELGRESRANALAIQADGKIVAAGVAGPDISSCGSFFFDLPCHFAVVRYDADGGLDASFGGEGKVITDFSTESPNLSNHDSGASAVALQADGGIVAAGTVTSISGEVGLFALARYLGDQLNTPLGSPVVSLPPVTLTFDGVTEAGNTTVSTSSSGPPPPSGFRLGSPPTYFDITTTAVFTGPVLVCIDYTGIAFGGNEANLRLFHHHGSSWVDATVSQDIANNIICASVTSLSPFAIFAPESDTTPPVIGVSLSSAPNAAGWHNVDVTVTWSVTDPESGLAWSSDCDTTTLTADTAGTMLTCSATNGAGLRAAESVTLQIDKTPPLVDCAASPDTLWPPDHKLVEIGVAVSVSDALSGGGGFVLTSVASSEPDDGTGDGARLNDTQGFQIGTPDTTGWLRAERAGSGNGRVYTLGYVGKDRADNVASCAAAVIVPHDRR